MRLVHLDTRGLGSTGLNQGVPNLTLNLGRIMSRGAAPLVHCRNDLSGQCSARCRATS